MKKLTILLFTAVLFSGCMVQKPTAKNYKRVLAMENLTPVTVEQLRQLIAADTTHYKVVVLTSSCCGPCEISMRDVYPKKMAECDSSQVRWYFVETDYSTAQYMDEVFRRHDITLPRYWINDTLPQYRPLMVKNMWQVVWNVFRHWGKSYAEAGFDVANNRLDNIANDMAPQLQPVSVTGTPTTMMLDPRGRLKCTYVIYSDGTAALKPTDIRHITVPMTALDYTHIDTLTYAPKVCTPDGKCE